MIDHFDFVRLMHMISFDQQVKTTKQIYELNLSFINVLKSQPKTRHKSISHIFFPQMSQTQFSIQAFIFIFILIIYILAAHFIDVRKVPYIHESAIAMIMGFFTALTVFYVTDKQIVFNSDIFFSIILPPIIFAAGYKLRKSLFFQNLGLITFLGILGTVIGFICLAVILSILDDMFFDTLSLKQVLMISSVLCATDTVACVSLLKPQKYPILHSVLFGEGIINDAVAIILFRTVEHMQIGQSQQSSFGSEMILKTVFEFFILFFCSLIIGAIMGFGLSYLLKINESLVRSPIKETSLILLTGYATYLLGEICGFSGIITLFTCSIIMGRYAYMNISVESQRGTGLAFQTVAYVAEAFVYAYLGASIFSVSGKWSAFGFSLLLIPTFPIVRGVVVYLLPCIYKVSKKQFPLQSKQLKVCWYSGMVRGVIAFALSLQIQSPNIEFIQTISVVVVMTTTLIGSSMLKTFMKCIKFGLDDEDISPQNIVKINDNLLSESEYNRIESDNNPAITMNDEEKKKSSLKKRFQEFEANYVVPIFKKPKTQVFSYEMVHTIKESSNVSKLEQRNFGI